MAFTFTVTHEFLVSDFTITFPPAKHNLRLSLVSPASSRYTTIPPPVNPNFQHFLQAGAARVMVLVRKGYEDYVGWYMTTGEIWGGGEPPIVDDPHFVSLLSEIKGEDFDWESETWETRVPTSLTWLQPGTDLNAY